MCQSLISPKLIDKLVAKIAISQKGIIQVIDDFDMFQVFLEVYRAKQHTSPDFIWNQRTRDELKMIFEQETEGNEKDLSVLEVNPYRGHVYTEHNKELIVEYSYKDPASERICSEKIFVRLLNKDGYFACRSPYDFLEALAEKLKNSKNDKNEQYELSMAIRGCILSQSIIEIHPKLAEKIVNLIEEIIDYKDKEVNLNRFSKLMSLNLEVIGQCVKRSKPENPEIILRQSCAIVKELIYKNEENFVPMEGVISLLQIIVNKNQKQNSEYLWDTKILLYLIRLVYKSDDSRSQAMIIDFLICNPSQNLSDIGRALIKNYLPLDFDHIIVSKDTPNFSMENIKGTRKTLRKSNYINLHGKQFEEAVDAPKSSVHMIEEEIERLTQDKSESLRVIWSKENTLQLQREIEDL